MVSENLAVRGYCVIEAPYLLGMTLSFKPHVRTSSANHYASMRNLSPRGRSTVPP